MSKHKAAPKPSVCELKVNRVLEDSELAAVAGGVPDREGGSCVSAHRSRLLGRFWGACLRRQKSRSRRQPGRSAPVARPRYKAEPSAEHQVRNPYCTGRL